MKENYIWKSKKSEFNLVDEPWIKVLTEDLELKEVSIRDCLLNAHKYLWVDGECDTQNIAVTRILLALVHTILNPVKFETFDDAINTWANYFNEGHFPEEKVNAYLDKWHDRFYLFDEAHPFMQVRLYEHPLFENFKVADSFKLDGLILQGNNSPNLHTAKPRGETHSFTNAEAARWLLHYIAYDDGGLKAMLEGKNGYEKDVGPGPNRAGWLAFINVVLVQGNNLFETLMYNACFLKDGSTPWSEDNKPVWERDHIDVKEGLEADVSGNQAALLTNPSRYVLLGRNPETMRVEVAKFLKGEVIDQYNAFFEQATCWRKKENKKQANDEYLPNVMDDNNAESWRRYRPWKELSSKNSTFLKEENHKPGVLEWLNTLERNKKISNETPYTFKVYRTYYAQATKSKRVEVFCDEVDTYIEAFGLDKEHPIYRKEISDEIDKCIQVADELRNFVAKLQGVERYKDRTDSAARHAKSVIYSRASDVEARFLFAIDNDIRTWLIETPPSLKEKKSKKLELQETVKRKAKRVVSEEMKKISTNDLLEAVKYEMWFQKKLKVIYGEENKKTTN